MVSRGASEGTVGVEKDYGEREGKGILDPEPVTTAHRCYGGCHGLALENERLLPKLHMIIREM